MKIKFYTRHYTSGNSARITISTVREDAVTYQTDRPEQLYQYWHDVVAAQPDYEPEKETLVVVLLNTKMNPFAWHRVSIGTVAETMAHPREIMRPVIAGGAWAFALMHNHPSGDPLPSRADNQITTRIRECAELFQINFMDHLIVGHPAAGRLPYFSFKEAGLI
jgi:DNA repair protein RadC